MTIKYQAEFGSVKEVEVEKETEKTVWIKGYGMRRKDSSWRPLFDTREQAWDWIVADKESDAEEARRMLRYCEEAVEEMETKRAKALLQTP